MDIFGRTGRHYDFGPLPVIWSRNVWSDLAEKFLAPQGMSFLNAIELFPSEMRWYGEALLKFKSIDLLPVETLFRCYHYEDQFREAKKSGESDETLRQVYLGICSQSNWDKELDYGQRRKRPPIQICSLFQTQRSAAIGLTDYGTVLKNKWSNVVLGGIKNENDLSIKTMKFSTNIHCQPKSGLLEVMPYSAGNFI